MKKPLPLIVLFLAIALALAWWLPRGPGPLDWRDGEGNPPGRMEPPGRFRDGVDDREGEPD